MSDNSTNTNATANSTAADAQSTSGSESKNNEGKQNVSLGEQSKDIKSADSSEHEKLIKDLQSKLSKYEKAEKEASEKELLKKGEFEKVISEREKTISELQSKIKKSERFESLQKHMKENGFSDDVIYSNLTKEHLSSSDSIFKDNNEINPKEFDRLIDGGYKFLRQQKVENAKIPAIDGNKHVDLNQFMNNRIKELSENESERSRVTGKLNFSTFRR